MEISVIGCSQVNLGTKSDVGFCNFSKNFNFKICNLKNIDPKESNFLKGQRLVWPSKSGVSLSLRASGAAQIQAAVSTEKSSRISRTKPNGSLKLYVGLPLDTVSNSNTINHARAVATGLKALKLLGVEGVELPIWWGIAEKEAMGKYDWTGYLAIVEMVQKLDLKLHISLCFHGSEETKIALPQWVSQIGESDPSIYFTDRSGNQYKDCLSLAADDLPVLDGKTPLDVYKDFLENFKSSFSPFIGSTITGISVGLGPDGELRYPSNRHSAKKNSRHGAGEFQCYDKNMLSNLKHHAEKNGAPLYGLGGPHDAPSYDQSPFSGSFFAENGGSWENPYGDFFLSWYSQLLIRHGDRVLSLATSTFKDMPITLSGKIPLMHGWNKSRSHPSELAAGFYNTSNRDGYEAVAKIFADNSCKIILPGMDLSDEDQPTEFRSSPESLLAQIMNSCRKYRVEVSGQNLMVSGSARGFEQIKKNLMGENAAAESFTYQRMGAYFFSPEHFPSFTQFARGLNQPIQSFDDVVIEEEETEGSHSGANMHMQAA